jgi:hypothetical protein
VGAEGRKKPATRLYFNLQEVGMLRKLFFVVCLVMVSSTVIAGGLGTYSQGYRMGQLTKFSIKGLLFKSGEGQMLMGSESTPLIITSKDNEGNTTQKTINPWYFSASKKDIQKAIDQNLGEYVVLQYHQSRIKSPNVNTPYEIVSVEPISEPINDVCIAQSITKGHRSDGKRVGRIVKASNKGHLAKSWEIIIQQGNSGNQFKSMSISKDEELFNCAVRYLKAGQKVKITYNESHVNLNVFGRNTSYDIVKIEPVAGLN